MQLSRVFSLIKNVFDNFKMVSPFPAFWWFGIGYIAQKIYPATKLNTDNMSATTVQVGLAFSIILTLMALFLSIFWESKPNESRLLNFLYFSSRQFLELVFAVAGFSAAYFLIQSSYQKVALLGITTLVMAVLVNHFYLHIFNCRDVGTLKYVLYLDQKCKTELPSMSVKVITGLLALVVLTFTVAFLLDWLRT